VERATLLYMTARARRVLATTHTSYAAACDAFYDVADFLGLNLSRYHALPPGAIQTVLAAAANPPFNLRVSTLRKWVSALRHEAAHGNLAFPTDWVDLNMTLAGLNDSEQARPPCKRAYTREDVRKVFALPRTDIRILTLVTMFMLQVLCGYRGDEVRSLRVRFVKLHTNHVSVFVHRSKRDKKGIGFFHYLPRTTASGIPVYDILRTYFDRVCASRARSAYLFSTDTAGNRPVSYTTHQRWYNHLHRLADIDGTGKTTHAPRLTCQTFLRAGKANSHFVLYHLRRARPKSDRAYCPVWPIAEVLAEIHKFF